MQPSFEEGFGLTVLEAMTMGVPVVAASRGALPELLDGAGLLVPPDGPDAMAAAIERYLDDDALAAASAERGIRRAAAFSWQKTAASVYSVYERAIAVRAQAARTGAGGSR